MADTLLILGNTGTGKSTAIKTLNPETTFIVQCVNKELPFRGFKKKYLLNKNRLVSSSYKEIGKKLLEINDNENIKTVILDDITYLMTNEYMMTEAKGFDKFNNIAENFYKLINYTKTKLREELTVIFIGHEETDNAGRTQMKTVGKLLSEKICIEGMFSIVLNTFVNSEGYYFQTQNNGFNTTKSPQGMFEDLLIPNDLSYVIERIKLYYDGGDEEIPSWS